MRLDDDSEPSLGEFTLLLLQRIEREAARDKTLPHGWNFHVVRDQQGFIKDVIATPLAS